MCNLGAWTVSWDRLHVLWKSEKVHNDNYNYVNSLYMNDMIMNMIIILGISNHDTAYFTTKNVQSKSLAWAPSKTLWTHDCGLQKLMMFAKGYYENWAVL